MGKNKKHTGKEFDFSSKVYLRILKKLTDVIAHHGTEGLAEYLGRFNADYKPEDAAFYQKVVTATCKVYGISKLDLHDANVKLSNIADARRTVASFLSKYTNLSIRSICNKMRVGERTISKYRSESEDYLNSGTYIPSYKEWNEKYSEIKVILGIDNI